MQTFPRLAERFGKLGARLSRSEQQMLATGRALMTQTELIVLDEVTEDLAPMIVAGKWLAVAQIRSDGIATLIVDHDYPKALAHSDHALVLYEGVGGAGRRITGTSSQCGVVEISGGLRFCRQRQHPSCGDMQQHAATFV